MAGNDQMDPPKEEHLFILDWGDASAHLLYAHVVEGKVDLIDAVSRPSLGVKDGVPRDEEQASKTIQQLLDYYQTEHRLQVQTLFVLVKTGGKLAHRVKDVTPYQEYLTKYHEGRPPSVPPNLKEVPHVYDPFDAFASESEAFRYVFALPPGMREIIQEALFKVECFVEGFVSLPRIGVKSRSRIQPGLVLGIFHEISIAMAAKGDDLPFYREFRFSTGLIQQRICDNLKIPEDRASRLLKWVIRTPSPNEFATAHPKDQDFFMSPDFKKVIDDTGEELEKLCRALREDMIECGAWDLGFDHVYLLGQGKDLFQSFAFLSDILPFQPLDLPLLHFDQLSSQAQDPELAPMVRLVDHCLHLRDLRRKGMSEEEKGSRLKNWAKGIFPLG